MADDEEQSELAQATAWLQRVTRDPMRDAAPGRLTVVSASEPAARGRYQECRLELRAEADGIAATTFAHEAVFDRRHWPKAGAVVAARISRTDPRAFEADWSRL